MSLFGNKEIYRIEPFLVYRHLEWDPSLFEMAQDFMMGFS